MLLSINLLRTDEFNLWCYVSKLNISISTSNQLFRFCSNLFSGHVGKLGSENSQELGLNPDSIQAAVEFAQSMENTNPRNMEMNHYQTFGREPLGMGSALLKNVVIKPGSSSKTDTL